MALMVAILGVGAVADHGLNNGAGGWPESVILLCSIILVTAVGERIDRKEGR